MENGIQTFLEGEPFSYQFPLKSPFFKRIGTLQHGPLTKRIGRPHLFRWKVNHVRGFLEKGHRVEARIIQGRAVAEDVLDLALRIIAAYLLLGRMLNFKAV